MPSSVRDLLAGVLAGAAAGGAALGRFGSGEAGLRMATRATGQAALLPFAPYFARPRPSRRRWLWRYAGVHLVHAALLGRLLHRHGHPARGTPVYPVSVYGGSAGYAALALLLARRRSVPSAEWLLFAFVQGAPIPHGALTKPAPARGLYPALALLWLAAGAARLRGR